MVFQINTISQLLASGVMLKSVYTEGQGRHTKALDRVLLLGIMKSCGIASLLAGTVLWIHLFAKLPKRRWKWASRAIQVCPLTGDNLRSDTGVGGDGGDYCRYLFPKRRYDVVLTASPSKCDFIMKQGFCRFWQNKMRHYSGSLPTITGDNAMWRRKIGRMHLQPKKHQIAGEPPEARKRKGKAPSISHGPMALLIPWF